MKKILVALGTRPEAIKLAPVVKELKKHKNKIRVIVCVLHSIDRCLIRFSNDLKLIYFNQHSNLFTHNVIIVHEQTQNKK